MNHHVTIIPDYQAKIVELFNDFIEKSEFYSNLRKFGYNVVFCYHKKINCKKVEVHFNLVWGDIHDADFHRQELSEVIEF